MSFDYLIKNTHDAFYNIRCWVEMNLNYKDLHQCRKFIKQIDKNDVKFPKSNSYSKKMPTILSNKLIQYFEPIKYQTKSLIHRNSYIMLGPITELY